MRDPQPTPQDDALFGFTNLLLDPTSFMSSDTILDNISSISKPIDYERSNPTHLFYKDCEIPYFFNWDPQQVSDVLATPEIKLSPKLQIDNEMLAKDFSTVRYIYFSLLGIKGKAC